MKQIFSLILLLLAITSCDTIDDNRIPALAVNIELDNVGLWNTYGVGGAGQYRYFIRENKEPANFPFTETTYTGFGGVLLISGTDPYSSEPNVPLAYDMACPVECQRDIRVRIEDNPFYAVCPSCGSTYNVFDGGGTPVSGPAADGDIKFRLQPYTCIPTKFGGYVITR